MKPNILCIMTDQMRFDAIAELGNPDIYTPNLDRLVRRGAVMSRAYSNCPVCVPARYAIRTGSSPLRSGSFQNEPAIGKGLMEERCGEFLAKAMRRRGYRTFGIGKFHAMSPDTDIGYDVRLHCEDLEWPGDDYVNAMRRHPEYGDVEQYHGERTEMYYQPQLSPVPAKLKSESWVTDRSLEQMSADDDRPWFGFVSFLGPHPPFAPPEPYNRMYDPDRMRDPVAGPDDIDFMDERVRWNRYFVFAEEMSNAHFRTLRARYYGTISYIDSCIGRLLDAVDDDTFICFTADHGEFLGDHQAIQKENFFEESVHVPMLISWPGQIDAGSSCDAVTMLSDLFGLFTSAAGDLELRDGADLFGVLQGRAEPRETAFSYSSAPGTLDFRAMALRGPWKYIFHANGGGELLFNLDEDPREHVNRIKDSSALSDELRTTLIAEMKRFPAGLPGLENGTLKTFPRTPLKMERVYQFRHYCGIGKDGFPAKPEAVFQTLEDC